jgi:hypothetical protein
MTHRERSKNKKSFSPYGDQLFIGLTTKPTCLAADKNNTTIFNLFLGKKAP